METQELIRELCVLADEEQDPEKLIKLARMILVLLGTQRQEGSLTH